MGHDPQDDRRSHRRLSSRLTARYRVLDADKDLTEHGSTTLTRDIGGGGLCIATPSQLAEGTPLELFVQFPDRPKPMTFTAVVVWSRPRGTERTFDTGLKFASISMEDRKYIQLHASLYVPV
jgi:Tfp pilus assembly protein PilZ